MERAGNIDRWVEQFEERARVAGWNDAQKLFQLKAHLEKTAEHTVPMLPEEKTSYASVVMALQKQLRGLEFHQLMQDKQSRRVGHRVTKAGTQSIPDKWDKRV